MHGSSGTKAGDGECKGASSVVSELAKEEDCSSSEGTVVSSSGAGGDNIGCNGAEGTAGVTGVAGGSHAGNCAVHVQSKELSLKHHLKLMAGRMVELNAKGG